jgi:putative ABC transport system permease protein
MSLAADLHLVLRRLRRAPGFVLAVTVMLALGIGLSVAMFSVLRGVVLNALPFEDAQALVALHSSNPRQGIDRGQLTPGEAVLLSEAALQADSPFASFGYYNWGGMTVFDGQRPRETSVAIADDGFFRTLGMRPLLGREFTAEEYAPKSAAVILSHQEWQRLLGGRPEAIGTVIDSSEGPLRVVGVMPPAFAFPAGDVGAWLPRQPFDSSQPSYAHAPFVYAIGRLRPELAPALIAARLDAIAATVRERLQLPDDGRHFVADSAIDEIVGDVRGALWGALGIALTVLLIACTNVAILFDARQVEHGFEQVLSQALGASSGRIWRTRMLELGVLATLGVVGGLAVAFTAVGALRELAAGSVPRAELLELDLGALGVALLLGAATPLIALAAGALRHRLSPAQVLRSSGKGLLGKPGAQRRLLPIVAMAISTVSLVAAVALGSSMLRLRDIDPGFRTDDVLALQLFRDARLDRLEPFAESLRERLAALPGVAAVAFTSTAPLTVNGAMSVDLELSGRGEVEPFQAGLRRVDGGFREVLDIPLLSGRNIGREDTAAAEKVAVINRELAQRSFGTESPLGQTLLLPLGQGDRIAYRIVGVVDDIHNDGLRAPPAPEIWVSYAQSPRSMMTFLVRTLGTQAGIERQMADQVWALDPRQAITRQFDLTGEIGLQLQTIRFFAFTVSVFAFAAVLLGAFGVYAVASLQQRRRIREFGLRLAVGARPANLGSQILGDGLISVIAGALLGVAGAWLALQLIAAQTFGLEHGFDRVMLMLSGVAAMAVVALSALLLPAMRAMRLDPMVALRHDA